MKRFVCALLFASAIGLLVGCGNNPAGAPPLAKVSGMVNLDGKPMGGGEVRFEVAGQPSKSLAITDGAFSGDVHTGKNRVDVVWDKDGPPHPMDPTMKIKVNAVDAKFLGPASPLSAEVPASGASDLKFDVTSAKK